MNGPKGDNKKLKGQVARRWKFPLKESKQTQPGSLDFIYCTKNLEPRTLSCCPVLCFSSAFCLTLLISMTGSPGSQGECDLDSVKSCRAMVINALSS